ncbi:MAG: hypothetical protein XE03_1871, partial [candidate division TA06 bacterium 34_109]
MRKFISSKQIWLVAFLLVFILGA